MQNVYLHLILQLCDMHLASVYVCVYVWRVTFSRPCTTHRLTKTKRELIGSHSNWVLLVNNTQFCGPFCCFDKLIILQAAIGEMWMTVPGIGELLFVVMMVQCICLQAEPKTENFLKHILAWNQIYWMELHDEQEQRPWWSSSSSSSTYQNRHRHTITIRLEYIGRHHKYLFVRSETLHIKQNEREVYLLLACAKCAICARSPFSIYIISMLFLFFFFSIIMLFLFVHTAQKVANFSSAKTSARNNKNTK